MNLVQRRDDGSIALYINGDLQFDSNDERIYHEALALPGLAIAQARKPGNLRVLIVGGGDGLIARELFKSSSIGHIDLVDYDQEIVDLARKDFAHVNAFSLHDARLTLHVRDAWQFVDDAATAGVQFDLIVSDLTVPDDATGARFHSIEWYRMLARLLGSTGVLSVNGVSPQATPQAFLSIFNAVMSGGLHPRPYHVSIPSFAACGYGHDWGFLMAGTTPIAAFELEHATLAQPRMTLMNMDEVRRLFVLPEELFAYQSEAVPGHAGSSVLIHYFKNTDRLKRFSDNTVDSFNLDTLTLKTPAGDTGENILPPELRTALAECIYSGADAAGDASSMQSALVSKVLELMPSLQQFHTKQIIADFVDRPAAFLQAIDISTLVSRLLERAAELPAQLVEELKHLHEKLTEWAGDYLTLVKLGERVVTILTLVVVVGNLVYPDAVYAKGGDGGHGGGGGHGGDHGGRAGDRGVRVGNRAGAGRGFDRADRGFDGARNGAWGDRGYGYGGYHGYWGHNWGAYGWARPWHGFNWGGYVPPVYVSGNNWPSVNVTRNQYVDETGNNYPAPTYNYNNSTQNYSNNSNNSNDNNSDADDDSSSSQVASLQGGSGQPAVYKLGGGADLLANGTIAISLTDQAYLMPTAQGMQVVDQSTGQTIMWLASDPALVYQAAVEIQRQRHRLLNVISNAQSGDGGDISSDRLAKIQEHADRLQTALQSLGTIPQNPPSPDEAQPLVPGGVEVFASVWMTPDGKFLAIKRTNGQIVYMNGAGWYSNMGQTKLKEPYPAQFKSVATAFLSKMVSDSDSTKSMLMQDQSEGGQHVDLLNRELAEYQGDPNGQPDDMVDYGSGKARRSEAIRLTQLALSRTQRKLDELQDQVNAMPAENNLARQELSSLGGAT